MIGGFVKKDDLPWMKWFWGDWFKAPEVRALSPETRCAWFEMLGLMWESTERGYLTLNGRPYPIGALSRCLGFAQAKLEQSISEMESFNVFSRRDDGAIYNRRMVADCELGEKRAIAGQRGGICSSKTRSKLQANHQATCDSDSDLKNDSVFDLKDKEKDNAPEWKKSFEAYTAEIQSQWSALSLNRDWLAERERYHPNLDIRKSLEKAMNDFWGTEAGWKHKKKKRAKEIDLMATLNNALTMRSNQVFKARAEK